MKRFPDILDLRLKLLFITLELELMNYHCESRYTYYFKFRIKVFNNEFCFRLGDSDSNRHSRTQEQIALDLLDNSFTSAAKPLPEIKPGHYLSDHPNGPSLFFNRKRTR